MKGFDLNGGASYLKTRFDRFDNAGTSVVGGKTVLVGATGNQLPFSPHWQLFANASWRLPVDWGGSWRVGANVTYETSYYSDVFNYAQGRVTPQSFVDANLSYTPTDSRWNVAVIARNLSDHRHYQSITWGGTPSLWYGPVSPPRTIFFKVGYSD